MTTEIINIISNLSGAVAVTVIFIWFLREKAKEEELIRRESIKLQLELAKTLQKLTDVIIEQNKTIQDLKNSIKELRDIIQKMYKWQMDQAKKIKSYEKRLADCEDHKKV